MVRAINVDVIEQITFFNCSFCGKGCLIDEFRATLTLGPWPLARSDID